jgi:hypothetical protein
LFGNRILSKPAPPPLPTCNYAWDILTLCVKGGSWAHAYALIKIWEASQSSPPDPIASQFRDKYLKQLFPLNKSPLFHNVTAQVLVVTRDDRIVIARRKRGVVNAGCWSATLEEQMLRRRQKDGLTDDLDLFRSAERGTKAELGITPLPGYPKLLGFGLIWDFGAAFLFLLRCAEDFAGVVQEWSHASEVDEAVALDALPARPDAITRAMESVEWSPLEARSSPLWNGPGEAAITAPWHPTSQARLYAYLRYLEALAHSPQ